MYDTISSLLRRPAAAFVARVLVTLPFWTSGLAKLINFEDGVAEMAHAGLQPAIAFNLATIATQLIGSVLIVLNRGAWLGAAALSLFTGLTILLVHHFWAIAEEPFRTIALHVAIEHVGMIGGLMLATVLSAHVGATSVATQG